MSYYEDISLVKELSSFTAHNPYLRSFSHYVFGSLLNIHRGNNISAAGIFLFGSVASHFWYYFPLVYLIKVPLALHLLVLLSLLAVLSKFRISKKWSREHFFELSALLFIFIYFFVSIQSKLNIGLRHIFPIFPFLYILTCLGLKHWIEKIKVVKLKKRAISVILIFFVWYIVSSLSVFPHYLSYFNELVGGSKSGYQYVVDSNCDWGQDLKRLSDWVDEQGIKRIYIDYFGGGDVHHYLGEKAIPWYGACWWTNWIEKEAFPAGNYLVVSATFLQQDEMQQGTNVYRGCYEWLDNYYPVAQVGNSILVYYID